jgi:glutaredoxin 3
MVCIPCIVIPFVLWLFHKYVQPFILKFWNPWEKKSVENKSADSELNPEMADSKEYQFVQKLISENAVVMFSKPSCPYCKMAKEVLDNLGVDYVLEEIDHRPDCSKLQEIFQMITGARTVPRVFIGGKCIGGGSEAYSLHNQGKLEPLCKAAGATFKKAK